ncbi:MAG: helix-turn-helix transcriptional regulator [Methanoregulaceae archaeon]|jgi:AraC-like DNA-binding protein|nr:helix-turn-helix transcriptional regulator [Methanoregulaceae archaeon]
MAQGCPFHSDAGGIALSEIGGIVRCANRLRMVKALDQLQQSIVRTSDLDEARGAALMFIAMVTAATMEMGGAREMHRVQLEAARAIDKTDDAVEVGKIAREIVEQVLAPVFDPSLTPTKIMMDRALAYIDQNLHRQLDDDRVAREVGLSTSHFRHLFRQATGQPFRKYLMALRLERARKLLVEGDMPVSEVAIEVGFTGVAHFTRAFAQRFSAPPSSMRRGSMAISASE